MQEPIGKKVVYVPKRGRKGLINITAWAPMDAEIPNVARIIEETPLYAAPVQAAAAVPEGWRCFHCDEAFTDVKQAALHFGTKQQHEPVCQVSAERLREMELLLERYQEEDTDLHRQIYGLQAQHAAALRREEEQGYARGLRDAGLLAAAPIPPTTTLANE